MEYTTLGRTGLRVSVAGLGCGGFSRLGLGTGKSEADAIDLVHQALDLGVNLFDTASVYGTEEVLGKALKAAPRDQVVIATKASIPSPRGSLRRRSRGGKPRQFAQALDTDYIDVFQLHGVAPEPYDHARDTIAPALLGEKAKGKIPPSRRDRDRPSDGEHRMAAARLSRTASGTR